MIKRKLAKMLFSVFFIGSVKKRAIATSFGLLLVFLPLQGYGWIVGFVLAFLFGLNLWAILIGVGSNLLIQLLWFLASKVIDSLVPLNQLSVIVQIIIGCLFAVLLYFLCLWFYEESGRRRKKSIPQFVFEDDGRRVRFAKQLLILAVIIVLFSSTIVVQSLLEAPSLPTMQNKQSTSYQSWNPTSIVKADQEFASADPTNDRSTTKMTTKLKRYGFYVPWDIRGWVELKDAGVMQQLDVIVPGWYSLGSDGSIHMERQVQVDNLAKQKKVNIMPLLNNVHNGQWDGEFLHHILRFPAKRSSIIQSVLQDVQQHGYIGVNIDFEGVLPNDRALLVSFMQELSTSFHQNHLIVTEDVPAASNPAYDLKSLSKDVDQLVVMMYDQHYATGQPGSVAPLGWMKRTLEELPIPKEKQIISLGNYGYDWIVGSKQPATPVSFDEIMARSAEGKIPIKWDTNSKTPYLAYHIRNEKHFIGFLDGASFYNEWKLLQESGATGVALWRIGTEDPSIWNIFDRAMDEPALSEGTTIKSNVPLYRGDGEIVRIQSFALPGSRQWITSSAGWVTGERYSKIPVPTIIQLSGKPKGKVVSLTFDDGPDDSYTGQILDILHQYGVKATFFIVGQNAVQNPALIKRTVDEGNEVGNHTYTHPEVAKISDAETKLELNTTQRFFEQATGRSLTFFRPPYEADAIPTTNDELLPIWRAQQLGYTMVGESIDTTDWEPNITAESIVRNVKQQLPLGSIILMHDAGGDRSQTVQALPQIIQMLKQAGYRFETVSELMHKTSDQVMPAVHKTDGFYQPFDHAAFTTLKVLRDSYTTFLYVSIGIGCIRVLFLMYFSYKQFEWQRRRRRLQNYAVIAEDFQPTVTVVIAAYNEEEVINKTIASVLESDYPDLEIIVIDDGSTDHTAEVVMRDFGHLPYVHVITKPNEGKTAAVNVGYQEALGEIIVSIDADTMITEDTISLMVRHFVDEEIAAVSGNVKVGNVHNLLTLWQHVEYITGFNLERRAFDQLNSIPVVPGAIGAWRRSAVEEAGYFQHDTLAEDTDITLTLLRLGYRIQYEDRALAYTEAPSDLKSFIKQRTRWIYGTLQCLWKHRGGIFSSQQKSLGYVTMPNMWLFQYVVQVMSPFVDLLCILSFFTIYVKKTLLFYLLFLLFDMVAAFFAFSLEKENPKPLIWLFLQRFVYRQVMSYVVMKSLFVAFIGKPLGWNKLKRQGNVKIGS